MIATRLRNDFRFSPKIIFSIFILSLSSLFLTTLFAQENKEITRAKFIKMIAQSQPDNPFLPKGHTRLSTGDLYARMVETLNNRGIRVLNDKRPDAPLTDLEFVRLTYALSGASPGKSLYQQKLYLKKNGILSSADIGLTTGLEGKVTQTHFGESSGDLMGLAAPIFTKDRIETDLNAKASLTFDDASTLVLSEDAVVNISKFVYDPDKDFRETVVNVAVGAVRFIISKAKGKGSSFKVVTPVSVAGVRGTEFVAVVKPNGETQFIGIKDHIDVAPLLPDGREGRRQIIAPGQIQSISREGIASLVTPTPRELLDRIQIRTQAPKKIFRNKGTTLIEASKAAKSKWLVKVAKKAAEAARHAAEKAAHQEAKSAKKAAHQKLKAVKKQLKADKKAAKQEAKAAKRAAKKELKAAKKSAKEEAKAAKRAAKKELKDAKKAAKGIEDAARKAAKREVGAVKEAAKDARDAARKAAKHAAKDAKKAAERAAKANAERSAKSAAKHAAKDAAKGAAKNAARDAARLAAKVAAKSAARDAAKTAAASAAKSAASIAVKEAAASAAKAAAKLAAIEASKSAKDAAKDAAKAAKEAAKAAAKAAKEAAKAARDDNRGSGSNSGRGGGGGGGGDDD